MAAPRPPARTAGRSHETLPSRLAISLLALLALAALPSLAAAQGAYPNRPVKIIAPVQPGGGVDLVARQVGERLAKALGQPVVIENQSGGGGIVGSQATARAAPDGYTLMIGYVGTHGTNPAVRKLPYDAVKDFTPIAMVGGTPNVLVVPPSLPATTLRSSLPTRRRTRASCRTGRPARARSRISRWNNSRSASDLDVVHIAYRGIGPAITDILGGQTQALFPGLAAALPHIKAGKMRPLAVTGTKRHPLLPDVPTFEELGYKGFDGVQWYGIVGARQHAAGDRRDTQQRDRQDPGRPAVQGAPRGRSAGNDADDACAVRPIHPRRHREVDQGREGTQHRVDGVTAPIPCRTRRRANRR